MLAGRYDEGILGRRRRSWRSRVVGLEGRYFYIGPRLMTPEIDASERGRAQVDRMGVYVNARWGPYSTRYSVATFRGSAWRWMWGYRRGWWCC